jgi:hypothetical protein
LKEKREGVLVILSVGNGEADVRLGAPSAEAPGKKEVGGDVVLVAYLRKAVTAIGRGENAGRTLDEYNIVRAVMRLGRWDGGAQEFHAKLNSLPQDATDVAVLVQSPGQGAVVGAATQPVR